MGLLLAACNAASASDAPAMEHNMAQMEESADGMSNMMGDEIPANLDTTTQHMSDKGLYHVAIASNLEPIAANQMHSWTIQITTPAGQPVENADIIIEGGMPQHNHGFPTAPRVTSSLGDGKYLIEGVKFNMGGWWEIKFNIAANGQHDSVTFNIILP